MASADERLQAKLAARDFADPAVRSFLDDLSFEALEGAIGEGTRVVTYHRPAQRHWSQGDGRPALADDDPAVMQAIGRCAASRSRGLVDRPAALAPGRIHPESCGWCDMPLGQLLAACEWDAWRAYYVIADVYSWVGGKEGDLERPTYARPGPWGGTYRSPDHAAFWQLAPAERRQRVEGAIEASRRVAA